MKKFSTRVKSEDSIKSLSLSKNINEHYDMDLSKTDMGISDITEFDGKVVAKELAKHVISLYIDNMDNKTLSECLFKVMEEEVISEVNSDSNIDIEVIENVIISEVNNILSGAMDSIEDYKREGREISVDKFLSLVSDVTAENLKHKIDEVERKGYILSDNIKADLYSDFKTTPFEIYNVADYMDVAYDKKSEDMFDGFNSFVSFVDGYKPTKEEILNSFKYLNVEDEDLKNDILSYFEY